MQLLSDCRLGWSKESQLISVVILFDKLYFILFLKQNFNVGM
jgi:hypothetical protein